MHIGRPVVIHPHDEDILDALVDSSTSDQQDAAKHGQTQKRIRANQRLLFSRKSQLIFGYAFMASFTPIVTSF